MADSIDTDHEEAEHGDRQRDALAVPTRRRIFELISGGPAPVGVEELVQQTALHPNTVRLHLARLLDAGLITQQLSAPAGRGRPGYVYQAAAVDPNVEARAYRLLAGWLAQAVRTGSTARAMGNRVGRGQTVEAGTGASAAVFDAFDRLGFAPLWDDEVAAPGNLVLRRCPFASAAAEDPATICSLHLGIAEGVVASAGGRGVAGLHAVADPHAGGCRLRLVPDATGQA